MDHCLGSGGTRSHGVIFYLGPAKVCSPALIETDVSYDKDIWIAVTDNYMYFFFKFTDIFCIKCYFLY